MNSLVKVCFYISAIMFTVPALAGDQHYYGHSEPNLVVQLYTPFTTVYYRDLEPRYYDRRPIHYGHDRGWERGHHRHHRRARDDHHDHRHHGRHDDRDERHHNNRGRVHDRWDNDHRNEGRHR